MKGRLYDLAFDRDGTQRITVTVGGDFREMFDELKDKEVDVSIKPYSQKRSRSANAYCWTLCTEIGNALNPPLTKEEVYKRAIRDVGEYEPLPIKNEAVETFQQRWSTKGTGWFAEIIDDSKIKGYKLVFAYYGSSTYNTKSMSRLIDYLVQDAKELGIPTDTPAQIAQLQKEWAEYEVRYRKGV